MSLIVTVSGVAGAGKSRVAALLYTILEKEGIRVFIDEKEVEDFARFSHPDRLANMMSLFRERSFITIRTENLNRRPK